MAKQEISQVVMDANTVTTITNNLNSLYSSAISQLTTYTMAVVALVGILIPVLVTLIQWRSLKAEKENLERHISDEIAKAKLTMQNELAAELKGLIESEERSLFSRLDMKFGMLEKKLECAQAASFHIQGNSSMSKEFYYLAAEDFCHATIGYLRGEDELNGRRTLNSLIQTCLPKINKVDYEKVELDGKIGDLLVCLKEFNQNNRYADYISDLTRELKQSKVREP